MNSPSPLLRLIRDDEPEHPPAAAPAVPAGHQMIKLDGDRMAWPAQAKAAAAHGWHAAKYRAKQLRDRPGGVVGGLMDAHPPSVTDQREYAKGRAWVLPGHEGGVLEGMGVVWGAVLGPAGVALGGTISALSAKPLRGCIAAGFIFTLALIVLAATGHRTAAIIAAAAAAVLAGLWVGAALLWLRLTAPPMITPPPADDDETES